MLNPDMIPVPGFYYSWDECICLGLSHNCINNVPQVETQREKTIKNATAIAV